MAKLVKCDSCDHEIAKGVKKCPNCGAKQGNFFTRHKILTGFGIFIIIAAIAGGGGESSSSSSSSSSSVSSESKATVVQAKVGDQVEAGKFSYKVQSTRFRKSVGNEFMREKADGIFLLVKLSVINNDTKQRMLDNSLFEMVNSKGGEIRIIKRCCSSIRDEWYGNTVPQRMPSRHSEERLVDIRGSK